LIISSVETSEVRYLVVLSFILVNSLTEAQNLYISSGGHLTFVNVDVLNEYFVNRTSLSSGTTDILNKYREASFNFSYISLLFEKEITNHISFKSGIYLHREKGNWTESFMEWRLRQGSWREYYFESDFSVSNIDIPFLLTYNPFDRDKKFNAEISFGPYIGYGYDIKSEHGGELTVPAYLNPLDYGISLSAGFGLKKWQLSFYHLRGLKNTVNPNVLYNDKLKEVKSSIYGVSLARVIHFSKKRDSRGKNNSGQQFL
jgi:hypothetical protein